MKRVKIEFWLGQADKLRLVELCEKGGYTVAEIMRRAVEAQLKAPPKKIEKKITKAPKPVSTVRGSSGGSAKTLEDAARSGAAEYQRMRMEQMKNKGSSWG